MFHSACMQFHMFPPLLDSFPKLKISSINFQPHVDFPTWKQATPQLLWKLAKQCMNVQHQVGEMSFGTKTTRIQTLTQIKLCSISVTMNKQSVYKILLLRIDDDKKKKKKPGRVVIRIRQPSYMKELRTGVLEFRKRLFFHFFTIHFHPQLSLNST